MANDHTLAFITNDLVAVIMSCIGKYLRESVSHLNKSPSISRTVITLLDCMVFPLRNHLYWLFPLSNWTLLALQLREQRACDTVGCVSISAAPSHRRLSQYAKLTQELISIYRYIYLQTVSREYK